MDAKIFRQQYKDILQGYLHEISFEIPPLEYDPSIEKAVVQHLQARGFTADCIKHIMPTIQTSSWIATSTYPFTAKEIQVVIAIYTTLAVMIDDTGKDKDKLADLRGFHSRLLRREPQPSALLEAMIQLTFTFRELYGPFISDLITTATLEFVNGCILENEYEGKLALTPSAPDFPYYLRLKTGIGEAYAFFAFPRAMFPEEIFFQKFLPAIPGLTQYFTLNNDLLSFYKESVVSNERLNYIYNHSRANNVTALQSLQETRVALVDCVRNVRETLAVEPQMQNNIEQLFRGYVMYHFGALRYRLSELGIREVDEVLEKIHFPTND